MKTTYQLNEKKVIFTNSSTSKKNIVLLFVLMTIILLAFTSNIYNHIVELETVTKIDMLVLLFKFIAALFVSVAFVIKPLLWSVYGKEQIYFGTDFLVHRVEYGWFKGKRHVYKLYSPCDFEATPATFMTFSESTTYSVLDISTERTKLQTKSKLANEEMQKLVDLITVWYNTEVRA